MRVYPEILWHPSSTVLQIDVVYWVFEYSQQIYGDDEQSLQFETSIELSSNIYWNTLHSFNNNTKPTQQEKGNKCKMKIISKNMCQPYN